MDWEAFEKHKPFAGERKPSMLRRRVGHDYESRRIYLVTMTIEDRRPLLGHIIGKADAPDGSADSPRVVPSKLGEEIQRCWQSIPDYYPEVKPLALQLMPDHLHGIIFVTSQMEQHLGIVLKGFKTGCNRAYRQLGYAASASQLDYAATVLQQRQTGFLFSRNYNDHILEGAGELNRWLQYLKENPWRLLMKREHPDLFRLHRQTEVCGLQFTSMGNHFLLDRPSRQQVEISRSATDKQISDRLSEVLTAARHGAVTYTAAISDGEKLIARNIREQGLPLVVLLNEGFPEQGSPQERYYKPGGVYFEACSQGRLLLMEPHESAFLNPTVRSITEAILRRKAEARHIPYTELPTTSLRYRFLTLNTIAHLLAEE